MLRVSAPVSLKMNEVGEICGSPNLFHLWPVYLLKYSGQRFAHFVKQVVSSSF